MIHAKLIEEHLEHGKDSGSVSHYLLLYLLVKNTHRRCKLEGGRSKLVLRWVLFARYSVDFSSTLLLSLFSAKVDVTEWDRKWLFPPSIRKCLLPYFKIFESVANNWKSKHFTLKEIWSCIPMCNNWAVQTAATLLRDIPLKFSKSPTTHKFSPQDTCSDCG